MSGDTDYFVPLLPARVCNFYFERFSLTTVFMRVFKRYGHCTAAFYFHVAILFVCCLFYLFLVCYAYATFRLMILFPLHIITRKSFQLLSFRVAKTKIVRLVRPTFWLATRLQFCLTFQNVFSLLSDHFISTSIT